MAPRVICKSQCVRTDGNGLLLLVPLESLQTSCDSLGDNFLIIILLSFCSNANYVEVS